MFRLPRPTSGGRRPAVSGRSGRPATLCLLIALASPGVAEEGVTILGLFRDRVVLQVDGRQRVLTAGQTSPEGITLISSTSSEAVLEFDGQRATYTLGTHIGTRYQAPPPGVTVTVAPDDTGMYRVGGSINGFQTEFIVDTGATLVSLNRNEARRMGIDYRMRGREAISSTAAGPDRIYIVKLERVRVGEIELLDVDAAVHDGDHPPIILLGNSFLARIDLQRQGPLLQLKGK
ncbi:MAG: TIGR02281 family clan AA aspartic protease [Gammaproteobacteria bacterium]|nr:TIGR02281 family clan AA aspartic protease [Gammaproteobacteria bacterium]